MSKNQQKLIGGNYLFINDDNVTYFDRFGVEYIQKKIKEFISNKNMTTNIYRIQAND